MSKLDQCLLDTLARLKFATRTQLSYWCGNYPTNVSARLTQLNKANLVSADANQRPTVWATKNRNARVMLTSTPSGGRHTSWSVMANTCHKNEVEIILHSAKDSKGFKFLDRLSLLKQGLNPGHGEYGGEDATKHAYLVLIDDYFMKPERISHTWERAHHPPRKHFSGNRSMTWSKIVNYFVVATTDELRAEKHATWIEKHEIPAKVIIIKPLWS